MIKLVKMGKEQSKPTATQEELDKCRAKDDSLEEMLTHYSDGDHNPMESRQTNLGIFSVGVENNSNRSSNCDCSRFWGILEVLATIGITILIGFILFRFLIKAEKEQRMVRLLEERVNRDHSRHTAIEMQEEGNCSRNHLHIPKRVSQIESAPPSNPEISLHQDSGDLE